jgi:hypothetical protein
MSDESTPETPEPTTEQAPPGTPWPDPIRTTDSYDGPPPMVNTTGGKKE